MLVHPLERIATIDLLIDSALTIELKVRGQLGRHLDQTNVLEAGRQSLMQAERWCLLLRVGSDSV